MGLCLLLFCLGDRDFDAVGGGKTLSAEQSKLDIIVPYRASGQFSDGNSARSTTNMSAFTLFDSSLSPNCSCKAVIREG